MVNEAIPSLFPEAIEQRQAPSKGMWGYYRKPNGWIAVTITSPSNRRDFEYKGFVFLQEYGEFKPDTADPRGMPKEVDDRGIAWNTAMEPWRRIFQRGGAKEFCAEQIIAYRWHVRPPYREVSFPQLNGIDVFNFPCPECVEGLFASTNEAEAIAQLKAHLTSKTNGQHSYTPTDLRALGQELGVNFDTSRIGRIKEIQALQAETPPVLDLTPADTSLYCEEHDWSPPADSKNPQASRMMHERHNHKEAVLAGA